MFLRTIAAALTIALAASFTGPASAQTPIVVRFGVNASGGQTEVVDAVKKYKLDKKYGFDVQETDLTAPGQQYVMFRGGAIDVAPGTFVDLLRQRKAGVDMYAFHGFQGYNNYIVTKPNSPIKSFADIRGHKMGEFGTTFLDWLILRAASKKAYGYDIEQETTLVQGTPPLLNQLLAKDQVDVMLQFSSLALGPLKSGDQRFITDVPGVMRAAGFNPNSFNSNWNVAGKWNTAHPGALRKLSRMIDEAYVKLKTDDALWPSIAAKIGFTDPAVVVAYRDLARRVDNPPYTRALIGATQSLVDAIVAISGSGPVGFTQVDPAAFLFPNEQRR
jgi:ABC-type nitrate/sulfonate/bicarbonate transport system substrate-binding protein